MTTTPGTFYLNGKKFLEILTQSMKIIQIKSPVLMYSTGLFQVNNNKLSLTVTDMDHTLTSTMDVEGDNCNFIVKIQDVFEIIKKLQGKITIQVEKNKVKIHREQSKIELLVIEEEFIKTSLDGVAHILSIDSDSFKNLFGFFPITNDEWNFQLQINNNYIQAIGNNRKCLVFSQIQTNNLNSENFTISYKTLNLLYKHGANKIEIYQRQNQLIFKFEEQILWSRLLNNQALNYDRILAKRNQGMVILLDKKTFLDSLSRVSLLSSKISRTVKLLFQENNLFIQASDASRGTAEESIIIESTVNGSLALNCDFLISALKTINSNTVALYYTGHISHFFICSEDKSVIHVSMPLNIDRNRPD
jgi:DNA polymerase-3 subunit beta